MRNVAQLEQGPTWKAMLKWEGYGSLGFSVHGGVQGSNFEFEL